MLTSESLLHCSLHPDHLPYDDCVHLSLYPSITSFLRASCVFPTSVTVGGIGFTPCPPASPTPARLPPFSPTTDHSHHFPRSRGHRPSFLVLIFWPSSTDRDHNILDTFVIMLIRPDESVNNPISSLFVIYPSFADIDSSNSSLVDNDYLPHFKPYPLVTMLSSPFVVDSPTRRGPVSTNMTPQQPLQQIQAAPESVSSPLTPFKGSFTEPSSRPSSSATSSRVATSVSTVTDSTSTSPSIKPHPKTIVKIFFNGEQYVASRYASPHETSPLHELIMPTNGSSESSPTDFAFEPPVMDPHSAGILDPSASFKGDALKTPSYAQPSTSFTATTTGTFPFQAQNYPNVSAYGYTGNSASSFSSASGSAGGTSFSSADALPAISRDFVRPSENETRRPATAGGALQSRSPFGAFMTGTGSSSNARIARSATVDDGKPETIDEVGESMFTNPFGSPDGGDMKASSASDLDMSFNASRRASEPQFQPNFNMQGWENNGTLDTPVVAQQPGNQTNNGQPSSSPNNQFSMASAPPHMAQFGFLGQAQASQPSNAQYQQIARSSSFSFGTRPQTSDGIPSYGTLGTGVSLPSARTIVNQIDPATGFPNPPQHVYYAGGMPFRDARAASMGDVSSLVPQYAYPHPGGGMHPGHPQMAPRHYSISTEKPRQGYISAKDSGLGHHHQELTFVPLGGPAPKKRPRRRYDEIERLYLCGWNGCEKSYGTLNHLNAHVAMQKHGEKRLPTGKHLRMDAESG